MRRLWTETQRDIRGQIRPRHRRRPGAATRATTDSGVDRHRGGQGGTNGSAGIADGWFPMTAPGPKLDEALAVVRESAIAADRDPDAIGMEGRVNAGDIDAAAAQLDAWADAGASHVSVNTMGLGLRSVDDHLATLARVAAFRRGD